ncbi:MAG: transcriptional repressor LexA [Firmicutes bacterium]|nr:transcriptional repressor LexA [Bacillota bacterium]
MTDYLDLNPRQAQILEFIKQNIKAKGYPPSVREIGEAIGLSSPSTVQAHLNTLEKKGYISRGKSKKRAIELSGEAAPDIPPVQKEMVEIPIVGQISAGLPLLATENIEDYFPAPLDYIHSNKELFILRVHGESMIEAGIFDGDLLIVEKASTAMNGEIVVAMIEDEATVKTFYREENRIRLQPENSSMQPIYAIDVKIIGKPIGLYRRF